VRTDVEGTSEIGRESARQLWERRRGRYDTRQPGKIWVYGGIF
jgi:hypothetical protein